VRQAFNHAFDFEWSNKNFFHHAYKRTASYFEGSELAARGVPKGAVQRLLQPYRKTLGEKIFTQPFQNPKTTGSGQNRKGLLQANKLLNQAGWKIQNNRRVKNGQPLKVSFLLISPAFEKIVLAYKRQLEKLGIRAQVQLVDPAQYRNRLKNYDFDIIIHTFAQSLSPGNEQIDFWSSRSAKVKGGRNLIGVQNKVVDVLIEKIIAAKTRTALIAATQALDFVLLSGHYVVPQWFIPHYRIAYWKPLRRPKQLPDYGLAFPETWWVE
jgi:microcin C transport system substrate-binding protein